MIDWTVDKTTSLCNRLYDENFCNIRRNNHETSLMRVDCGASSRYKHFFLLEALKSNR